MLGKTDSVGVGKFGVSDYTWHALVGFMLSQHNKRDMEKAFTDFRAVMTLMDITTDLAHCGNREGERAGQVLSEENLLWYIHVGAKINMFCHIYLYTA